MSTEPLGRTPPLPCLVCDYDLAGCASAVCPECGREYVSVEEIRRICEPAFAEQQALRALALLLYRSAAILTTTLALIVYPHWYIGSGRDPADVGLFSIPVAGDLFYVPVAILFAAQFAIVLSILIAAVVCCRATSLLARLLWLPGACPRCTALIGAALVMFLVLRRPVVMWLFD